MFKIRKFLFIEYTFSDLISIISGLLALAIFLNCHFLVKNESLRLLVSFILPILTVLLSKKSLSLLRSRFSVKSKD
jgi:hypothetical protein